MFRFGVFFIYIIEQVYAYPHIRIQETSKLSQKNPIFHAWGFLPPCQEFKWFQIFNSLFHVDFLMAHWHSSYDRNFYPHESGYYWRFLPGNYFYSQGVFLHSTDLGKNINHSSTISPLDYSPNMYIADLKIITHALAESAT